MRFSTDGGSTYVATGYNWALWAVADDNSSGAQSSGSDTQITIAPSIGNGAAEGYNGEVTLLNQTSAAFWSRVHHQGYAINNSATPMGTIFTGGGAQETAQDTDAVRFYFSSGNIAAGNYAVYGLV